MSIYLGIDPGVNGGIAVVRPGRQVQSWEMPKHHVDVWHLLNSVYSERAPDEPVYAMIEKVGGFMGSYGPVKRNVASAHTMFNFGESFGALKMALVGIAAITGVREDHWDSISPRKWQHRLGKSCGLDLVRAKGMTKARWKGVLQLRAKKIFPKTRITLATADAILIAEYCRRVQIGLIDNS